MPAKSVAAKTMKVGKKGGGKHWTREQIAARKSSASDFERKDDAKIQFPIWLSKEGQEIWKKKLAEIEGLKGGQDMLDALDSEILALFCDAVVRYKKVSSKNRLTIEDHKLLQTYQLRILKFSEGLGFTPGARVRLIKKRADEAPKDDFGEEFD